MDIFSLFASLQPTGFRHAAQWFSLILITLFLSTYVFGLLSPVRAQTHSCAPDVPPAVSNPAPLQAIPGTVLINEVLSQPKSNWNCSEPPNDFSQEMDSWIELYNRLNQPVDLYAAHAQLSLNGGSTLIRLPFGSAIAAGGFLVVFPLEKQVTASALPWNIMLSVNSTIIDQVATPLLQPDQSYARASDGSQTWLYVGSPTIDASNNSVAQPSTPAPTKVSGPVSTPSAGQTNQPVSLGTQPIWKQVQLPSNATPTPEQTATGDSTTPLFGQPQGRPVPQNNSPNGWLIALLAFFSLLLLATLAWHWRLSRAT